MLSHPQQQVRSMMTSYQKQCPEAGGKSPAVTELFPCQSQPGSHSARPCSVLQSASPPFLSINPANNCSFFHGSQRTVSNPWEVLRLSFFSLSWGSFLGQVSALSQGGVITRKRLLCTLTIDPPGEGRPRTAEKVLGREEMLPAYKNQLILRSRW